MKKAYVLNLFFLLVLASCSSTNNNRKIASLSSLNCVEVHSEMDHQVTEDKVRELLSKEDKSWTPKGIPVVALNVKLLDEGVQYYNHFGCPLSLAVSEGESQSGEKFLRQYRLMRVGEFCQFNSNNALSPSPKKSVSGVKTFSDRKRVYSVYCEQQ